MPVGGPDSERALVLLRPRDAEVASSLLREAAVAVQICTDLPHLAAELAKGAGLAVIGEELVANDKSEGVKDWISNQPAWSDLPIVMLTGRSDPPNRTQFAQQMQDNFGNITFLERPFHPTTLISLARSVLRSRRRQYEARHLLSRYELLARELQHRTKNLLSVILSIASASLREGGDGSVAFVDRMHALAKAQDLLFENEGHGALLEDVVRSVLLGFGNRISIEGPQVHLKAGIAQGFALVVHELATNAAKYGALTQPSGSICVRWSLDTSSAEPSIHFIWQERGGPPSSPPDRRGFGTLLLERAVASSDRPPRFDYGQEGFTYELTALCQ
jgi:two-component sensor histidine kinase